MESQGGVVRWTIEADSSNFHSAVEDAKRDIDSLTDKANQADAKSSKSGLFSALFGNLGDTSKALGGIGSSLAKIGWGTFSAGATGATAALTSLVSKGIQATDFLETSRTAMSGLTGSITEGNKAMSIAANYWQNNPFQRFDVTNATQQLVQFGRNTSQIGADLETLGKVSLSTGVQIDELARYYARTSASGRAMTMDLEMMSDRGIPIYRELSKQLNTTTAGVREMASKGKIDFETFRKAMEGAVDAEAMKQFEETLSRQVDRFKGSIAILAGDLAGYKIINDQLVISANGLEKTWTKLVGTLATGLRSTEMREGLAKIGQAIADLMQKIFKFYEVWEKQADGTMKLVQHSKTLETVFGVLSKAIKFIGENSEMLLPILGGVLTVFGKFGAHLPVIGPIIRGIGSQFGDLKKHIFSLLKVNPILGTFLALFGAGFISSLKNSEEFRQSISELMKAVGRLAQALIPAGKAIVNAFTSLASSGAVTSILKMLVDVLTALTNVIAGFPTSVLTSIITSLLMVKLLSVNPLLGYVAGISLVIGAFKNLAKHLDGANIGEKISNGFKKALDFLKSLPNKIATVGHNIMVGLYNGLVDGARNVMSFVKSVARAILNTFKNVLGIHSPSVEMYKLGGYITLGLANGIEDSESVVQHAIDALATDILSLADKVIQTKYDFGLIDYNGMYKEWKKVSTMFTQGSQQYANAVEKMEEARKQVNLRIIELQKNYNDELDNTIKKIGSMQGIFQKVDLEGGMDSTEIIGNLDKQVAKLQQWASAQEIIAGLSLDPAFIEELQDMGVDAVNELESIANMTSSELTTLNDLWLKKQAIANKEGTRQMAKLKNDTLNEIKDLKKGIDGETVDVKDVGGRLVASIGEGVYGAIPTIQEAYSQLDKYMREASKKLGKSGKDSLGGAMEDAFNPDDVTPTVDAGLDEIKNDIGQSLEEAKQSLLGILGGVVGGIVAFKFGPKILQALGGTKLGSKLGGVFKGLFGGGSVAKEAAEAVSQSSGIAQSSGQIATNMQTTSTSLTKGQKLANTIIKGALAVILIAGAIAAMAGALRLTYELLKDVNLLDLLAQMGTMALVLPVAAVIMGVIGTFGKYAMIGSIATTVISGGLLLSAMALAETGKYVDEINLGEIVKLEGILAIVSGIMAVIAGFAVFGAIGGIANTILSGGLLLSAMALAKTSAYVPKIKKAEIAKLSGILAVVDIILGLVAGFAVFAGIGSIANTVLAGGLLLTAMALAKVAEYTPRISEKELLKLSAVMAIVDIILSIVAGDAIYGAIASVAQTVIAGGLLLTAMALAKVSEIVPSINETEILKLEGVLAVVSILLGLVSGFAVFGAIASIAQMVISGGLLVAAIALAKVCEITPSINESEIDKLNGILVKVDVILGLISAFAALGAISAICNDIIVGGLVLASQGLLQTSMIALGINEGAIDKLLAVIGKVDTTLGILSGFSVFAMIGTLINDVIVGGVKYAAEQLLIASALAMGLREDGINKLQWMLEQIASWNTGDLFNNLSNLINSGLLTSIASNVRSIIEDMTGLEPIDTKVVESIKRNVETLSQIKIEGSGLFENKGGAAQELVTIVKSISEIAWILFQTPTIRYDKVETLVSSIKLFDRVDDATKDGIRRLQSMGDALGNINWIKSILGDIPEDLYAKAQRFVDSVKLFDRIDENARAGVMRLNDMRDALSNIDWIKHILGDIPADLPAKAQSLVDAIHKLSQMQLNKEEIAQTLAVVADLTNKIKQTIINTYGAFKETGNNIAIHIANGIREKLNDIYTLGRNLTDKFRDGINANRNSLAQAGRDMQGVVWNAIQPKLQDEYYQGRAMGEKFRQGLYDIDYGNAGWWAVKGFENGAKSRDVYSTGWQIADKFLKGLKDRGRQGSPWKTTIESGNWAVEGLIEGIKDSEGALINEATTLADEVIDALSMDNLTLTPSLDASYNTPTMASRYTPVMSVDEQGYSGTSRRNVIIEQTNNNYTQYSLQQINKDLAWELSKI